MKVDSLATLRARRSTKWRTHPDDVLPLFVAEMDLPLAPPVADVLRAAVAASDTGYSIAEPELGRALAGFAGRRWGWEINPQRVTAVPDVGVGVVELLRVLTRPGETVVISPPVYPPFFHWAEEAGNRLAEAPLTPSFRLDLAALEAAFAARPAVYLLCNPQNPVGRVHSRDELSELVALASRYGVTIVSDEIHAPLVLPGATFTPLLSVPGAHEVGMSLVSAGKAFNVTGLKCAAIVEGRRPVSHRFPPDLRWRPGHFGVLASIAAFEHGDDWLDEVLAFLDERRTQLGELLRAKLPGIAWQPPEGTYLAWLNCHGLGLAGDPAELFLQQGRVGLEPGPRFGAPGAGFVRLNFATSPEILDEATTRMAAALPRG
ncbi:MalY/PatB family protein [Actinoplanes sp. N902-109]|uniref:MalY/PatB family protein n=1 Tax=Actinoplanes sp. (strain N902-109) TaxID=649831 RepID=UPI00032935F1|nr:aminotransferase class I/II-fold pyridoxal phosphate-dependent enzyme [Actinoplanes sp. N902-109]AGL15777.1 transferase [Actinoplanes sp. N902-109]